MTQFHNRTILLAASHIPHALRLMDTILPLFKSKNTSIACTCPTNLLNQQLFDLGFQPLENFIAKSSCIDALFTVDSTIRISRLDIPVISIPHAFQNGAFPNQFDVYFGGCDYYCAEQPAERIQKSVLEYKGCFSSRKNPVFFMPSGSLKLDALKLACDAETPQKAFMYCTNPLDHASSFLKDGHRMIATILEHFKEYIFILRPYPGDAKNPALRAMVSPFTENERFVLDTSSSTLHMSPKAQVVISNSSTTGLIFSYATLRPYIDYAFEHGSSGPPRVQPWGMSARNLSQLITALQVSIENPNVFQESIREIRDARIYGVGRAEELLFENLRHIWKGKAKDEWVALEVKRPPKFRFISADSEALAFASHLRSNKESTYSLFVPHEYVTWHRLHKACYWGKRAAKRGDIPVFLRSNDSLFTLKPSEKQSMHPNFAWTIPFIAWGKAQDFTEEEHTFIYQNAPAFLGYSNNANDFLAREANNKGGEHSNSWRAASILFPMRDFSMAVWEYLQALVAASRRIDQRLAKSNEIGP